MLTPGLTIVKTAGGAVTTMGATVQYTITIQNTGQTPYTGAVVTDALAGVLDDATVDTPSADRGSVIRVGDTLQWTGDLALAQTRHRHLLGDRRPDRRGQSARQPGHLRGGRQQLPDRHDRPAVPGGVAVAVLTIAQTVTPDRDGARPASCATR